MDISFSKVATSQFLDAFLDINGNPEPYDEEVDIHLKEEFHRNTFQLNLLYEETLVMWSGLTQK